MVPRFRIPRSRALRAGGAAVVIAGISLSPLGDGLTRSAPVQDVLSLLSGRSPGERVAGELASTKPAAQGGASAGEAVEAPFAYALSAVRERLAPEGTSGWAPDTTTTGAIAAPEIGGLAGPVSSLPPWPLPAAEEATMARLRRRLQRRSAIRVADFSGGCGGGRARRRRR
jgi:hypothetical protein